MPVALCLMEHGEGLVQLVIADLVLVDVKLLEDGLVEQTSLLVITPPVQLLRVLQQREAQFDQAGGDGQFLVGLTEANQKALTLTFDVSQLLLDLGLWERAVAVGHQVDQVFLFGVKPTKLGCELPLEQPISHLLIFKSRSDVGADIGDEAWLESNSGVVGLNSVFHVDDIEVWTLARAVLLVAAEEVGVLTPARVHGALDDHA